MAALNSLVSGYGSDSDSDEERQQQKAESSSASAAATPSLVNNPNHNANANAKPLSDPPPKKRKERGKLQIGVESLSSLGQPLQGEDADGETESSSTSPSSKPILSTHQPSHSLFGLLPAPKRNTIEKKSVLKDEAAIKILEPQEEKEEALENDQPPKKKVKGNNDFRAMLGLKPSQKIKEKEKLKDKEKDKAGMNRDEKVETTGQGNKVGSNPTGTQQQVEKQTEKSPERKQVSSESIDFFSLGPKTTSSSSTSIDSAPTFSKISSAPVFEQESLPPVPTDPLDPINPYKGWNQDPDGSWVPVTPEAWSAYNNYLETQAQLSTSSTPNPESSAKPSDPSNGAGGGGFSSTELSKYGLQEEDLQSVDAGEIAARAYALRGVNDFTPTPSSSSSSLAATMSSKDKMKFNRARGKGQLSSLIAIANEKKDELEQKWSQGKDKQRQGGAKYGF